MTPRVSTIIPVYNGAVTVGAAIDSALAQDFDGQEIIVTNDGSTDETAEVLAGYGSRIRVVSQKNRGVAAARNAAAAIAGGEYLAFLDADDIWLDGKLLKAVAALEQNPAAGLSFSDFIRVDAIGRQIGIVRAERAPSMTDMLCQGWPIIPTVAVIRRSLFDAVNGFREEFGRNFGEDPYMWLVAREYAEFTHIAEPLALYREPPIIEVGDKYEPGLIIFERLVRERFAARGAPLIRNSRAMFAHVFFAKAMIQARQRDWLGASRSLAKTIRYRPSFFFEPRNLVRFARAENLAGLSKMFRRRKIA
ncbi:MAG: glycosyltransferase family 2 protein [Candidatus Binataceae bacterium]